MTMAPAPVCRSQGCLVFMRKPQAWPGAPVEVCHAGGVRSLDALRVIVQQIRRICLSPASRPKVKNLTLSDIDPANLSELGRERRRQALEQLREARRRLQRDACDGIASRSVAGRCYSNSISR
jgi:hypothetical protein